VFVFQGRAIQVARRYCDDPNQIAWNIAVGGKTVRVKRESWPLEAVKYAIQAAVKLGLDYAAMDVIVDETNQPYVLEANTAPGLDRDETIKRLGQLFIWAEGNPAPAPINWTGNLTVKLMRHPALANLGD
jgi:glutathione synthase/RimK-type ligase-like ATP-grasp enzyme